MMRPLRKLQDMPEVQALQRQYPALQTYEFQCNLAADDDAAPCWTTDPPLPPRPPPGQPPASWPPNRQKVLERIVVFWLDPAPAKEDLHECWVYGGLNAMPEEGFTYYLARYRVDKAQKTIACVQDLHLRSGGWTDDHTLALAYMRRCLPWLEDYRLVQRCRLHPAAWPDGAALLAAFTEGDVLESTERFCPEDDD
jgi:hypothetical protein